jgi:CO dehydrogenase/acetyl-CoA synthase delta subunit
VDKKLTKAKARLVEVDKDMVPLVQEQIRELQGCQDELKKDWTASGKPRKQLMSELNKQFDEAIKQFSQLRQYFEDADFAKLRQLFQALIDKVTIKVSKRKEGKRHRYTLLGGEIHLHLLEVSNSTRRTIHVINFKVLP